MRVSGPCSHDYPVWVYSDGSLWIYNASAGPTGRSAEVAQLSATTGKLETLVTLPNMPAGVIAADDDGFFVGPGDFYQPGQGIYHVAPRSSRAQFLRGVPGPIDWLFGFDHSMYAALQYDYAKPCTDHDCKLWRFDGSKAAPKLINEDLNPGDTDTPPVGNARIGILITRYQPPAYPTSIDVVQIDPSTGRTQILARVPIAKDGYIESTAYASGSLFALVDEVQEVGQTRLIRVFP